LGFNGRGGELFSIQILNMIKTVFTLGIYKFWAKTRVRQYLWSNTSFAGDRFAYHGTGMELFRGFVKFSSLLIVLVGSMAVLQLYGGPAGKTAADVIVLLLVFLGFPALMVGAWRYRLTRTSWRGIRFSFRGTRKQAVLLYLKGIFFMGLTLGLYWPFFKMEWEQFWRENSWFGDRKLEFTGTGKDLFGRYVLALLLTPLTLGLYWFWFKASLQRYLWSHTRFVGGRFRFTATGGQVLALNFVNLLILIVTLGLGLAWVIVRNQQFLADHLFLQGDVRLNQVVQEMRESGALGEEALDAMDVPLEIGI
ncbi:MAG: DUF898 family protein, partial [Nitrospinaceae bacterium]|nr:DUF898 domain-containing protein [Nitrospinaceae bacterium]NIR53895.1 DUF898 domain-containing protein [Nitrospinaceae bacterium]NIS84309.1 DUF898 domain-containing protein [Nitrospinaceae bacterium]NIT81116.1 DUF898 domain-containing protein [Nitrospinaceae bacterium]NIU43398.1 DUF898 domain-containing protein [Nitrospinaceae bacterium]